MCRLAEYSSASDGKYSFHHDHGCDMDEILREIRSFVATLVAEGIYAPERLVEDATESFEIEHRRGDLKPYIEQIAAEELAQLTPIVTRPNEIQLAFGLRGAGCSEVGLALHHHHDPTTGVAQGELRLAYRLDGDSAIAAQDVAQRVLGLLTSA